VPAIVSTLCCCLPAGIASIVYASKARSNRDMGNIPAALEASKQAKMWLIIAVVAGLAVGGIYVIAMIASGSDSGGY
jgi:orotate phosphoribosyltransferase